MNGECIMVISEMWDVGCGEWKGRYEGTPASTFKKYTKYQKG
jgi:hypothetical protein